MNITSMCTGETLTCILEVRIPFSLSLMLFCVHKNASCLLSYLLQLSLEVCGCFTQATTFH